MRTRFQVSTLLLFRFLFSFSNPDFEYPFYVIFEIPHGVYMKLGPNLEQKKEIIAGGFALNACLNSVSPMLIRV